MTDESRPDDAATRRERAAELDAELSALADGELESERERALRARIEREPELARRLRSFEQLGASLRELPAPALPADLEARLAARIAVDSRDPNAGTPRQRTTRRARWRAPAIAAAAIAAAIALYLVLRPGAEPLVSPQRDTRIAEAPTDPVAPEIGAELAEASDEELAIALELELLSDFEVIERLEVLERLAVFEEAEPG